MEVVNLNPPERGKRDIGGKFVLKIKVWKNVPDYFKVKPEDIGLRVWPAGEDQDESEWFVDEHHEAGEPMWKDEGGFTLRNEKKRELNVGYDQIILHPSVAKKRLKRQYEGDDREYIYGPKRDKEEVKEQKFENPKTGRMCSYDYAYQQGFIDEYGNFIPKKKRRYYNPNTGNRVGYLRAKQLDLVE